MKNQSGTIKTNLELDRVVMGVQVVTGDSQEEVLIFRYKQTDRHTLHHNIYIINTTLITTTTTIIAILISIIIINQMFSKVQRLPSSNIIIMIY